MLKRSGAPPARSLGTDTEPCAAGPLTSIASAPGTGFNAASTCANSKPYSLPLSARTSVGPSHDHGSLDAPPPDAVVPDAVVP